MLHILEQAQLIRNLRSSVRGVSLMNKPEKIFLRNASLIEALAEGRPDRGNIRDTFFLSQVQNSGAVTYHKQGDFLVNEKFLFEVGGRNKGKAQLHNKPDSFVVADGIEHGWHNKIPLWLFGFLY